MFYIKSRLLWKLVAINLLSVGMVILLVWGAIDYSAASYFMNLMKTFNIEPDLLHRMFLKAVHQSLFISMFLGLGLTTLYSFFITKKVIRSLIEMNAVTRKLAMGDYSERVTVRTRDEVGELGHAFNRMVTDLARIEQLRKDLVANVAHELRTPLHTLRGQIEATQERLVPLSSETIDSLYEEVLRLVRLVEALHRLSQIDANIQTIKKERFDLPGLIHSLFQKEQIHFDRKRIRLEVHTAPLSVDADPDLMSMAIHNLLQNTLRYTPEGGKARMDLFMQDRQARFSLTNSGAGIDPGDLPHIFERFYRGEKSRARETGGAGIGLAIVKQVVEAHGGTVGADSRPGETRIWLRLPL